MTKRIFLALLLAPVAAGCGSNKPTNAGTANGSQNGAAAAYAYSRCMRSNGVPNFPDPKVTTSPGHSSVGIAITVNPSETGSPKFASAQKKCQGIIGGPGLNQGQLPLPTVIAAGVDIHSREFLDAAKACVGVTHGTITMQQIQAGISGQP